MKQIKEKRNKSNMCTWLIIVLLAMYMYLRLNFLITFSDWWIALCYCGVFLVFMLLFYLLGKSIIYLKIIEISTIVFLSVWNIIYLCGFYSIGAHNTIEVIVPIYGYYTRRVDVVLFSYKGYKFNRTLNISDVLTKYGKDITKECELKLSLYEVYENFYYINYMDIVKKNVRNDNSEKNVSDK